MGEGRCGCAIASLVPPALMDEFLPYFRAAVEQPGSVPSWSRWWAEHRNRAEDLLDPADFELLRTGKLEAARMVLRRSSLAWPSAVRVTPLWGAPSLSEEKLAAFEQERAIRLPPDYREFLLADNGGYVRPCCFRCPGNARSRRSRRLWCRLRRGPSGRRFSGCATGSGTPTSPRPRIRIQFMSAGIE